MPPRRIAIKGNVINYLLYFLVPFPRGLCIDLEGSSTFLPLMLSMHTNRLSLFSHLFKTLFNCLSTCLGSWVGSTTLFMKLVGATPYLYQLGIACISFLGVNALGIGHVHLLGAKIVHIWIHMAI